jgi:hypothetical protein
MIPDEQLCWMCGKPADSREHIFKSRDLKRIFDQEGNEFENQPFHFGRERPRRIAGPKSNLMKYATSLCGDCNNAQSASFDRAYDRFSDWLANSQQEHVKALPLREVFGFSYREEIQSLRRYFAKSLGCRIVDAGDGFSIGAKFPNPLTGENLDLLRISISRTQLWSLLSDYKPELFNSTLGKGELFATYSGRAFESTGRKDVLQAVWHENIGHFQINYWLDIELDPAFGNELDGSSEVYEIVANEFNLLNIGQVKARWLDEKKR